MGYGVGPNDPAAPPRWKLTRIGDVFPTYEIGADPGAIRVYPQAAESPGYHRLLAYDGG